MRIEIGFLPKRRESVTHVSGTICYICVGSLKQVQTGSLEHLFCLRNYGVLPLALPLKAPSVSQSCDGSRLKVCQGPGFRNTIQTG
jgi:hypothetical protein